MHWQRAVLALTVGNWPSYHFYSLPMSSEGSLSVLLLQRTHPVYLCCKSWEHASLKKNSHLYSWNGFSVFVCHRLTCTDGGFTLQRQRLQTLLVRLQAEVGQVLFDLPGHLGVLVKLFGVQEGAASHSLLVPACLGDVKHCRIGTTLA